MSNNTQIVQGVFSSTDCRVEDLQNSVQVQRRLTIVVCNSSAFVRQDAQTPQAPPSDVLTRARQYLNLHHGSTGDAQSSLETLINADATSLPPDTVIMVFCFDEPAERLFRFLQVPTSEAGYKDGYALSKFLNIAIWEQIAGIRTSRPEIKIKLGSGPIQMLLEEFESAIKRLVEEGGVEAYVSAMGDTERSRFWRLLVKSNVSLDTEEHFTYGNAAKGHLTYATARISDIDFEQLNPRYTPHIDSDASDSTEEGAHEND